MQVDLTSKYSIKSDSLQYIVVEKSKVKDETSKNFGNPTETNIGYLSTIEGTLKFLLEHSIKTNSKVNDLQGLCNDLHEMFDIIEKHFKPLEKLLREKKDAEYRELIKSIKNSKKNNKDDSEDNDVDEEESED